MNRLLISGFLLIVMAACAPVGHNEAGHSHDPYTCPMHPQIVQEGPGTCPICFMDLVKASQTGINGEIVLSQQQMDLADRKSGVKGTSVSVRVDLGGRRIMKKKN